MNPEPVKLAVIPSFLRFRASDLELNLGPEHGSYIELRRGLSANLKADPDQRITGEAGFLDAIDGRLSIEECGDTETQWSGAIRRNKPLTDPETGFRYADYQVNLDLKHDQFDRILALFATGQELFGLSLDFQDIDYPDEPVLTPYAKLWDDVRFPHIAISSFFLRWKPDGCNSTPGYAWPADCPDT